jgi:hypothetical protein
LWQDDIEWRKGVKMDNIEKELKNLSGMIFHKNSEGKLHREDGPAVELPGGYKEWYLNNKLHRIDGPACEYANGDKYWYLNGERHRTDGPAIEYASGKKEWYLNGEWMTEEEFNKAAK